MHTRITLTICAFVLVGGCAAPVGPLVLGTNHPANPAAPNAPLPPGSMTLAPHTPTTETPMESNGGGAMDEQMHHQRTNGTPLPTPAEGDSSADMAMFTCPMHPDVTSAEPGRCLECNMKLVPAARDGHNHEGDQ